MHIPDSIVSPVTSAVAGVAMLPVWTIALRRVQAQLGTRQIPLLSLGAAFCFVIMMFNIPALGGTTAHPVAGTLIAVLLGPWAACIGVSVALGIQALFFGDGGLLAFGANGFAMAFALPFVGYSVTRALSGNRPANDPLRPLFAAIGAYLGVNVAAAIVAVFLGIQPTLFHEPNGQPLYFPFGLKVTLPAMLLTHLLVAGPAEALVTALVVRALQVRGLPLYGVVGEAEGARVPPRRDNLWVYLMALVALTPLGLLATGDAWGEWDAEGLKAEIQKVEGKEYVPKAVAEAETDGFKGFGVLSDYASEKGAWAYIGSGVLGVGTIAFFFWVASRLLPRPKDESGPLPPNGGHRPETPTSTDSVTLSPSHPVTPSSPSALPDWLTRPSEETAPKPNTSGRAPNSYLQKTLAEIAGGTATVLASETWARREGVLQRLDPRAKLLGVLLLLGVTATVRNFGTLLALYGFTLALTLASHLPVGQTLRRVWLSVPLFVGALALPAALNLVTPGRPLLTLWQQPELTLTEPGLWASALLTLRVGIAVSLATLLTLTTGWNDLLRALRALFVPRLFVTLLMMTYRYLLLLLQSAAEMFLARRSRTVGRATNALGRDFVGHSIGALFGKTLAFSEEVHAAMVSRGFQGEMPTLTQMCWDRRDTLWILAVGLLTFTAWTGVLG